VSRYAWGSADYHDLLRTALEGILGRLHERWGEFESRICVDTAPLLERAHAHLAGLGWIGKNTCLINEPQGSWFFLGEVLVSIEVGEDSPPPDRCGTCQRCVDACPTEALAPGGGERGWQLDARLCISTWTIEEKGVLEERQRAGSGAWIFGCDICQEVCPWNRRAPVTGEQGFWPAAADLGELAGLSREEFRERFRSTPLWRAKYEGLLRNVCTAMGNSGERRWIPALERLAQHEDEAVREHAAWALGRIGQT
jgi:epoxyqueuosine reductase